MYRNYLKTFFGVLFLSAFVSCQPDYYFEESKTLTNGVWSYADTLNYTLNIDNTQQLYNIYLDVHHATEYPYQNIYLMIHTKYPSGKRVSEQLPIDFADKTGQWYGKCSSDWCQLTVNLQREAFFDTAGEYTITVEQYLRTDSLPGIKNIALMLEDTGKQRSD